MAPVERATDIQARRDAPATLQVGAANFTVRKIVVNQPPETFIFTEVTKFCPDGLSILNAAFAWTQYEQLGTLTPQTIAYVSFWWLYMTSHYWYEAGVLSMWDVIAEKFGFMLVWGDYAFVPFAYSIVGWYLVDHTEPLPVWATAALPVMFALGLWIFRGANQQKHEFKRNRDVRIWGKKAEALDGKILVSGFWGIGRTGYATLPHRNR